MLCVLDGWGLAPDGPGNAVTRAGTPRLDAFFQSSPHARLEASGRSVGLPDGVMGNSEVGHLTMGAGYIERQSLELINDAVASGALLRNDALRGACAAVRSRGTLHLLGLLSTGGVHADMKHLAAIEDLAATEGARRVVLHAFLDGRDMPPRSALDLLARVRVPIATVQGRYYAMDRDLRWERTERAWRAIVDADGPRVADAAAALRACYEDAECRDELLSPHVVGDGTRVEDGDAIIFLNFRPDRARQLTWAFMQPDFAGFTRSRVPRELTFVTMTDYKVDLPSVVVAFGQGQVTPLASILARADLRQYHVAETEKYAHVTYFFNGGREDAFPGEDRLLVPSPRVATYDLQPAMSAPGVAEGVVRAVGSREYDFIVVNFASPDMVGHTGVIPAAHAAMRATDAAVGAVTDAVLAAGGCVLLTADHGNAEEMLFPDGGVNTQHSTNPVPVVFIARDSARFGLRDGGLRDIAPTLLALLGLPASPKMTGRSLLDPAP